MKMLKGQLSILLIIYIRSSLCDLESVYVTGKEIWKLYLMIDNMTSTTSYRAFELYTYQVNEIHKQLQKMENSMDSKIISDSFKSSPYPIMLYKTLDTLEIFILAIDQHYDNFRQQISEMRYNADDLRYFMRSVIPDIEEEIVTIRKEVLQPNELLNKDLIFAIAGHAASEQADLCSSPRILSAVLVQLFKMIVIAEMKAHVMSATVNRYQYLSRTDDTGFLNYLSRETLKKQISRYVNLFSLNIPITDGVYLKACEPYDNRWIRDESFYELEGTFQTAIFGYDWKKCNRDTCYDIWYEESDECEAHYYDDRSGCSGHLTECIDLDSIQACVLKSGARKFHYVNSTAQGFFGKPSKCLIFNSYIIEDGSDWNSSHHTCACNCLGNDNRISLLIMQSDVNSNMVITGLRFVRRNRILYIQPKEGRLDADGNILRYSERWLHIPKDISESQTLTINRENNVFFLDDLRLPSGCVLTGVKFNRVRRKFETGFAIEIFGRPFDYKSGELDLNRQYSRKASDEESGKPLTFEKISSALVALPLKPSPENKKYVSLVRSNLHEDFGQSTLPLFDAVPVTAYPASPLDGFGIFHKGTDGYAGFISLRVYGIKYAEYFTDFEDMYMKYNQVLFNCTEYSS